MVQVIQVFRPKNGGGQVDKSQPFCYTNMIPCEHDSPALIPKQASILKDHEVVFLITRSKNDNTVVYRAKTSSGKLSEHDPIDVYWMGFSRKDPHETDESKLKSELSWIEKKVAYGASAHKHGHKEGEFEVHLVALPHLKPVMKMMPSYVGSSSQIPRLVISLGGRECVILRVYVLASENMIGLPTVHWVNIHGIDMETGEEIVEKIRP